MRGGQGEPRVFVVGRVYPESLHDITWVMVHHPRAAAFAIGKYIHAQLFEDAREQLRGRLQPGEIERAAHVRGFYTPRTGEIRVEPHDRIRRGAARRSPLLRAIARAFEQAIDEDSVERAHVMYAGSRRTLRHLLE